MVVLSPPLHGVVQVQGCDLVYTPAPGYVGPDSLTYRIGSSGPPSCTGAATVSIDVADCP